MGLYLCIFRGDAELDGADVGSYDDFDWFRRTVTDQLEQGRAGSRFPVLISHSDCDGAWTTDECRRLRGELMTISAELQQRAPTSFNSIWQQEVARDLGLFPASLKECFFDVDGEPLVERVVGLCDLAIDENSEILFQ